MTICKLPPQPEVQWIQEQVEKYGMPEIKVVGIHRLVQEALCDVWNRIPPSARVVLGGMRDFLTVYLFLERVEVTPGMVARGMTGFRFGLRGVFVNGRMIANDDLHWMLVRFTLAHELAHLWLASLSHLCRNALAASPEIKTCFTLDNLGCLPWERANSIDADFNPRFKDGHERLADAVLLAWGFGPEYGAMLRNRGEEGPGLAADMWAMSKTLHGGRKNG